MIEIVTVSSRGQIVIPERIRDELGIEEGIKLVLVKDDTTVILQKEEQFMKKLKVQEEERRAWITLGEAAFAKVWDNPKDDDVWKKHL